MKNDNIINLMILLNDDLTFNSMGTIRINLEQISKKYASKDNQKNTTLQYVCTPFIHIHALNTLMLFWLVLSV